MLRDAGLSLAKWVGSVVPPGTGVRFDAPQADWSARDPDTPFIGLFLYDVRGHGQDLSASGWTQVRDDDGRVVGRRPATRYYRLSYLVTAWAGPQGAESGPSQPSERTLEEHRLLGLLIDTCSNKDTVAEVHLTGALAMTGLPSFVRCAGDEPGRSAQGLWPGFGLAPRAHLVLELAVPVVPPMVTDLAPPAREIALGAGRLPAPASAAAPAGAGPADAGRTVRRWERRSINEPAVRPEAR
ncbi:Pvc16 family protein [Streptacidiphilus anmyonensis]|uniref:Pvc16 family protein n=1 Tax=Streptacidiphilus anmyonensis TaxID=405782 RepID=UPI0005A67B93|nr:Pvc16 family protein [Streptacidiphilus anmyonensis]